MVVGSSLVLILDILSGWSSVTLWSNRFIHFSFVAHWVLFTNVTGDINIFFWNVIKMEI